MTSSFEPDPSHFAPGVLCGTTFRSVREINDRAARAASALSSVGVGPGDTIALLLRNDIPYFEASYAASMLRAAPVPVNWHGSAEEVAYVVRDSKAKVLVAHTDLLPAVRSALPAGLTMRVASTPACIADAYDLAPVDAGFQAPEWSSWIESHPPLAHRSPGPPLSMIYTSGTTGRPKGVRRRPPPRDAVAGTALDGCAGLERSRERALRGSNPMCLDPGMRTVVTGPMYHAAPNTQALTAVRLGGLVVLQPRFDPEELLALVEAHRITHLHLVPTMLVRLLRLAPGVRARYDLSSLISVVHSAAPCPPEIKRRTIEWLGPILHEYYGSTEAGPVTACTSEEWLAHPGTVGRPLPEATVRILGDDGAELRPGEVGEIYLRNHLFFDFTYEGRPEERRTIERSGLITNGDMGYLDAEGYLYLCDRKRDMIISGGVNIYPAEIEACLIGLDGVRDCAVFGAPDEEYGEKVVAALELEDGAELDSADVQRHVGGRLARFKMPRVVTFHHRLPREESGKILKRRLRAPYWQGTGRAI